MRKFDGIGKVITVSDLEVSAIFVKYRNNWSYQMAVLILGNEQEKTAKFKTDVLFLKRSHFCSNILEVVT